MGYLTEIQKRHAADAAEFEDLPIIEMNDLMGTPFKILRVSMHDIPSQFGLQHKAVCDIETSDATRYTVFLSGKAIVEPIEAGLTEGHDWNDGVYYVIDHVTKKSGGWYWGIREA